MPPPLNIDVLPDAVRICRLPANADLPGWATAVPFCSVTRSGDELSVICEAARVPPGVTASGEWRVLKLVGPFDFAGVGVLLRVAAPLAAAGVSILSVGTYDTDYVLVRMPQMEAALHALRAAGHEVRVAEASTREVNGRDDR